MLFFLALAAQARARCSTPTHPNVAFNQDDIAHLLHIPSFEACCDLCANKSGCRAYTWNRGGAQNCYLKTAPN